jgi:sulfur-carrier protein
VNITLLYFAHPKEALGIATETLDVPESVATLGDLLAWISLRGENWAAELAENRVRCAINQQFAQPADTLRDRDEVAIFSPISGG